jgi:DNA-binding NarL/FixJ family response regulator
MTEHLRSINGSYPGKDRVRVVLADDHAALRRSLRYVLDSEEGVEVVGEAYDTEGTLRQAGALRPDVLVLDMRMPNGSMVERIERLRTLAPDTQIVLITMHKNLLMAGGCGAMRRSGHAVHQPAAFARCIAASWRASAAEEVRRLGRLRAGARGMTPRLSFPHPEWMRSQVLRR